MSAATPLDLNRDQILNRYDLRIQRGDRTKLTREEKDQLALLLVDRLVELNRQGKDDQAAIRELCEAEKALLERGYPKGSINSAYLPNYTRLLKEAIAAGRLELSRLWISDANLMLDVANKKCALSLLLQSLAPGSDALHRVKVGG